MEFFTVLVWATVILIMFLSKMKAFQDVLAAIIMGTIFLIVNADAVFANFKCYKVFVVLRHSLRKDCFSAFALALGCLLLHGAWPDAAAPGVMLHLASLAAWILVGVQTSPVVSCGLWAGGRNQMTKMQLGLRILAQAAGCMIAFAGFALYYSFRLPGEGPFNHFFGLQSMGGAVVTFCATVAQIHAHDARREIAAAKAE